MKFTAFRIKNYKGINDTTVDLATRRGSVYALVGLNESGKTTILEAINNFRADVDGVHVIAQKSIATGPIESLVPKKNKHDFNDSISVAAKISMEPEDVSLLVQRCKQKHGFTIKEDDFPREFWVTRNHEFEHSAYKQARSVWGLDPLIRKERARKYRRLPSTEETWQATIREVGAMLPRIVYFPTFLFNFPDKILVSGRKS